jgi:formate dehydrogenase maturation protein FdhE
MPEKDGLLTLCPVCKNGPMPMLRRIEHVDKSVTVYLRCSGCSHLEIVQEQRTEASPN